MYPSSQIDLSPHSVSSMKILFTIIPYLSSVIITVSSCFWFDIRIVNGAHCRLSCTFFPNRYPHVVLVLFSNDVLALSREAIVIPVVCRSPLSLTRGN